MKNRYRPDCFGSNPNNNEMIRNNCHSCSFRSECRIKSRFKKKSPPSNRLQALTVIGDELTQIRKILQSMRDLKKEAIDNIISVDIDAKPFKFKNLEKIKIMLDFIFKIV